MLFRLRMRIREQGLAWLAGFVLIAAGIVCPYLSDRVARAGSWWQGTLDAFGVGLTVGGVVDVLAISGLDRYQRQRANNLDALLILRDATEPIEEETVRAVRALTARAGSQLDMELRKRLDLLVIRPNEQEVRARHTERLDPQSPPAETSDHGDAPQAPGNR